MSNFRPVYRGIKSNFAKTPRSVRVSRKRTPQPVRPIVVQTRRPVRYVELRPESGILVHRRGLRRALVGVDPREARAVSHDAVAGSLPERILYKALLRRGLREGPDFVFQVSLFGGRQEIAGMVADFAFYPRALIVRVQSDWHLGWEAQTRDDNQREILEGQGWTVLDLWDDTIYNEFLLEAWLRVYVDQPYATIGFRQAARSLFSEVPSGPF